MKTLAQKAADKQMEEAVARAIEAYGLLAPGHTMVEYLTIVEGLNVDEDAEDPESMALIFRHGQVRTSVAVGLTTLASSRLNPPGGWVVEEPRDG